MKDVSVMIEDVKFNYRAGLIFECNGKILVEVNPKIDFVTIPGGRIKTLESSKEGLKREIKEELGYDLDINKIVIENFFQFDEKKYHELYFLYKLEIDSNSDLYKNEQKNIDSVDSYYKWVDKDKLDEVNLLPAAIRFNISNDEFVHVIISDLK